MKLLLACALVLAVWMGGCKEQLPWSERSVGGVYKLIYKTGEFSIIVTSDGRAVIPSGNEPGNSGGGTDPGVQQLGIVKNYVIGSATVAEPGAPSLSFFFVLDSTNGKAGIYGTYAEAAAYLGSKGMSPPTMVSAPAFVTVQ